MSDWQENDGRLTRTFHFASFADAMTFMLRCGFEAEAMNHHPEWTNVYNKVTVSLTTHDAGNVVTEKDRELARRMNAIYAACKHPEN
jgi:4a-hydroxytetrahydrobiopterin dehydratase